MGIKSKLQKGAILGMIGTAGLVGSLKSGNTSETSAPAQTHQTHQEIKGDVFMGYLIPEPGQTPEKYETDRMAIEQSLQQNASFSYPGHANPKKDSIKVKSMAELSRTNPEQYLDIIFAYFENNNYPITQENIQPFVTFAKQAKSSQKISTNIRLNHDNTR